MSAAVFPAYWLARRSCGPRYALLAAAMAVAAPAMLYDAYLLSEALAYPVFLLTFAVLVRALDAPSPRWGCRGRGRLGRRGRDARAVRRAPARLRARCSRRAPRSAPPRCSRSASAARRSPRSSAGRPLLGTYAGLALLDFDAARGRALGRRGRPCSSPSPPGSSSSPARSSASALRRRPPALARGGAPSRGSRSASARSSSSRPASSRPATRERPLERYAIYLVAARRDRVLRLRRARRAAAHASTPGSRSRSAWPPGSCPSRPSRTTASRSTRPCSRRTASSRTWFGHANAATVFAAVPLLVARGASSLRPPRGPRTPFTIARHLLAHRRARLRRRPRDDGARPRGLFAPAQPDWLDEGGYGRADFLGLPAAPPLFAWTFEAWNRDAGRPVWLGVDAAEGRSVGRRPRDRRRRRDADSWTERRPRRASSS